MLMPRLNDDFAALMLSPLVVSARMPVLMAETLRSPFDRPETSRMVSEKIAAVQESLWAMSLAASRSSMFVPSLFWPPGWNALEASARSVGSAMVRPMAKRVKSNVKRLKTNKS
jgi:hypothetical protein